MRRVDVRAHPQARGRRRAVRAGAAQRAIRASAGDASAGSSSCSSAERRRARPRRRGRQPRFDQRVVVVAGRDHQLAPGERRGRDPRRTAAPPPSPRAAGRGAARARRRAAPAGRPRAAPRAAARAARGGAAGRCRESLPRCRSETISVRIERLPAPGRTALRCAGAAAPRSPVLRTPRPRAAAARICLGSMKRTSSLTTSNSEMSLDAARAEELDQLPHEVLGRAGAGGDAHHAPSLSHSSRTSPALSIRCASVPQSRATSTSRIEFDELREPITSIRSQLAAICLTAAWRLVVA